MANHLGLDLDLVEFLARVDADHAANHLGDDNHIAKVSLDEIGLLVGLSLLLGLPELLDQAHRLSLETTVDSAPGAGVDELAELIGGEVEKTVIQRKMPGLVKGNSLSPHVCFEEVASVLLLA